MWLEQYSNTLPKMPTAAIFVYFSVQITEISDANIIGDNLADVRFFILDTSNSDSPLSVNSSIVERAYELADVDEISGYTVSK